MIRQKQGKTSTRWPVERRSNVIIHLGAREELDSEDFAHTVSTILMPLVSAPEPIIEADRAMGGLGVPEGMKVLSVSPPHVPEVQYPERAIRQNRQLSQQRSGVRRARMLQAMAEASEAGRNVGI